MILGSGTFSTLVYVAYETVLPISLVDSHGVAPSTWGFLVVVNPEVPAKGEGAWPRQVEASR